MAQASHSIKSPLVLFVFSALLVLSMFYRVSNAGIALKLVQDLGLDSDHSYPAEAYHLSFFICFFCMAMSLIFYAFSKEARGRL